jgi:heparin/heparan-sulfate lyase
MHYMKRYFYSSFAIILLVLCSFHYKPSVLQPPAAGAGWQPLAAKALRYDAETARINPQSTAVVAEKKLSNNKGMTLKAGVAQALEGERSEPDIVMHIQAPAPGRYRMSTYAVTDEEGAALMKKAKGKYESLYARLQIDGQRPTKRVVYVPWDRPRQEAGKFTLTGKPQQLKIWLPRGVRLGFVEFTPYTPPAVPAAAQNYQPAVVPPAAHPRLWVSQQTLPLVKARLQQGENLAAWEKVKTEALKPFVFTFNPDAEMSYNAELERAAETKAFYYLMTGDKKIGREAVQLMADYLPRVEFGNLLDITREIGRAIFSASEVYDWCYDLLEPAEKQAYCNNLMRLADDMEIGWPPYLQKIVNGHGNEAQVNRDLLAMSIAIYNENPLPYRYCAYPILEELVPMRKFEYQSPRHNQGVNYGAFRFGWDMHAAWLLRRMADKPVFDDNIKNVYKYWLYMRSPDGQMLRDGDGFGAPQPGKTYYWSSPQTMLMCYAYAGDPMLKAEFQRQGGLSSNPVLFLLLNDPGLKAEPSLESLPLSMDFGPVLGAMIARTGWHIGPNSSDVVAEVKGGGYHFGNHQHADAGSIQIFYRGFQLGDIGMYKFYGTPYDINFNKRSISHSMMLAVDPAEKFLNTESNDGGARYVQAHPKTPLEAQTDPMFNNGRVLSADFGPSKLRPAFSYFMADLTGAYSAKLSNYSRGFCFLNLNREDIPAAIILTDDMTTAQPEFKKYWQINAHNLPEKTTNGVILHNERGGLVGRAHVNMLIPAAADRQLEVLSGDAANSSFKHSYEVPAKTLAEGNAHRILVTPKIASSRDRFLTVFQMTDGDTKPLPVTHYETEQGYVVVLADRVVGMSSSADLIGKAFTLKIPAGKQYQVVLAGMKPGYWNIKARKGRMHFNVNVEAGKNTLFFQARGGLYEVSPGQHSKAKTLQPN